MDQLRSLLQYVQSDHRICPRPMEWQALIERIGGIGQDQVWRVEPPLVLAAWSLPDAAKKARLVRHLEWAAKVGMLAVADEFLRKLPEEAWHHECPGHPSY